MDEMLKDSSEIIEKESILLELCNDMDSKEIKKIEFIIDKFNSELIRIKKDKENIELKYYNLYNHISAGYFTIDINGFFIEANDYVLEIFGVEKDVLLDSPVSKFIIINDLYIFNNFIKQIQAKETKDDAIELQIIKGDNSAIWVKISVAIIDELKYSFFIVDITEHKLTAELQLFNTAQLNTLSEVSPSGIWRTDYRGINIYVSPRWSEITGIPVSNAVGKFWWEGIQPSDKERVISDWNLAVEVGADFQSEFQYLKPFDETAWVVCNARLMKDAKGQSLSWVGTITDISSRKHNEEIKSAKEELDTARTRYFNFYDLEPADYCTLSEKGFILEKKRVISECNHNTTAMLKIPRKEFLNKLISDYIFIKDINIYYSTRQKLQDTREPQSCELRLVRSDGTLVWTSLELTATQNNDGEFLCRVIITDISGRKMTEEVLQNAYWRMESIIEGTNAGTWEWNVQTGSAIFNEGWAKIVGYTLKELEPISIKTWENLVHPDDSAKSEDLLLQHFAGELPYYDYECRMKHKDGHWIWVHDRGRVITRTQDGKPLMMFGTHTDITARKISEESIRESEIRFRNMFEKHSAVMLLIESKTGQIIDSNISANYFYGYDKPTMLTMNISDINTLSPAEATEQRLKAINSKENYFTFPHKLSNGDIRQVEVYSSPIIYHGESILFSIIHDITERKQYENALRIQHELSLSLGSNDNIYVALEEILNAALQFESIDCGGIYLANSDGGLDIAVHRGLSDEFIKLISHYPSDSPQTILVRQGKAIYSKYQDVKLETDTSEEKLLAIAIVPVLHNGELLALLNLSSHSYDNIMVKTRAAIETIAVQIGSILMRLKLHESLRESKQNLQTLFDTIEDLLFVLDESGNIIIANTTVYKSLGYTVEELAGVNVLAVHPADRRDEAGAIVTDMLAGKRDFCPVPLQAKNGTLIPVETRVTAGVWAGKPALFGISRDITERLIAKDTLEKQNLRLDSLIDSTHAGTWEWNIQTGEMIFNEFWANMFGYTLDELQPTTIKTWEALIHPDDLAIANDLLELHFNDKLPYYEFDCRVKHKDGHWVWVNDHGRVVSKTSDGKPLMMFGTHTDIYKHKKIEEDLNNAMKEIKTLQGIIPICAHCKNIRDDKGLWRQIEVYVRDHSEAEFSHGICPDCMRVLYPDIDIDEN